MSIVKSNHHTTFSVNLFPLYYAEFCFSMHSAGLNIPEELTAENLFGSGTTIANKFYGVLTFEDYYEQVRAFVYCLADKYDDATILSTFETFYISHFNNMRIHNTLSFIYDNYKNESAIRTVIVDKFLYTINEYYGEDTVPSMHMRAFDTQKMEWRMFKLDRMSMLTVQNAKSYGFLDDNSSVTDTVERVSESVQEVLPVVNARKSRRKTPKTV